jgi:hypothetical protein
MVGTDYGPDPCVDRAYQEARNHTWYMSARLVTLNALYTLAPSVPLDIDGFTDIIERNFRTPKEGLGYDNSPAGHMWADDRRSDSILIRASAALVRRNL